MEKFFYLRSADTITNDDNQVDSVMIPVSKITGIQAVTGNDVTIYWESTMNDLGVSNWGDQAYFNNYVTLNIQSGTRRVVMKAIAQASNSGPHDDGVVVIADDVTKTYISKYITSVDPFSMSSQIGGDVDTGA